MGVDTNRELKIFDGKMTGKSWMPSTMTVQQFFEKLHDSREVPYTVEQFKQLDGDTQKAVKDGGGFVAGELRDNKRSKNSVVSRNAICIDIDDIPAGGTDMILQRVKDIGSCYCVYSTIKHSENAPRLRVVFPLDRDVEPGEYATIARELVDTFDSIFPDGNGNCVPICDKHSDEHERLMLYPTHCRDVVPVYEANADLPLLCADTYLKMAQMFPPQKAGQDERFQGEKVHAAADRQKGDVMLENHHRTKGLINYLSILKDANLPNNVIRAAIRGIATDESCVEIPLTQNEIEREVLPAVNTFKCRTPHIETFSSQELANADLPPVQWIVEGLLPTGLALLCSLPKGGKSWMALDLCLSVAAGRPFLNKPTVKSGCLYLALEDSVNRLQGRQNDVWDGIDFPDGLDFSITAPNLENGLIDHLEMYVMAHPATRLIVIDTLQNIRGNSKKGESAYAYDYRDAGKLKSFADAHGICLLCIHHLNKNSGDADTFNRISGTNGLKGCADTIFVMSKAPQDANTLFSATGRDIEMLDLFLSFDKSTHQWHVEGTRESMEAEAARVEYEQSPIRRTVVKLFADNPDGWHGTASDLMEACRDTVGTYPYEQPKEYSTKLRQLKQQLYNLEHIRVDTGKKSNGHSKIHIYTESTQT